MALFFEESYLPPAELAQVYHAEMVMRQKTFRDANPLSPYSSPSEVEVLTQHAQRTGAQLEHKPISIYSLSGQHRSKVVATRDYQYRTHNASDEPQPYRIRTSHSLTSKATLIDILVVHAACDLYDFSRVCRPRTCNMSSLTALGDLQATSKLGIMILKRWT